MSRLFSWLKDPRVVLALGILLFIIAAIDATLVSKIEYDELNRLTWWGKLATIGVGAYVAGAVGYFILWGLFLRPIIYKWSRKL